MVQRADNGVVKSGAAARVDAFEGFLQLGDAIAEILVQIEIKVVVKIYDEGFVLRITVLNEGQGSLVDAWALVSHAAAVVDDQTHADRNVLALEDREFLLGFILEDAEIILAQTFDEFAAIIEHGGVQNDEVDIDLNFAP